MQKKTTALVLSWALIALLAGCSSTGNPSYGETLLEKNWGRSYETAKYNQILNPEAGKNLNPVEGLDGKAAENSVEKYENSFKKEMKQEGTATTAILMKQ